jgi:hypothetical protein
MEDMDLMPTLAEASLPVTVEQVPPELDGPSVIDKIAAIDEAREGFPGEHWLVLALGVAVWHFTRKNSNVVVRAAGAFGAATLVARAASGREGLSKVLRYTPFGTRISGCPPSVNPNQPQGSQKRRPRW